MNTLKIILLIACAISCSMGVETNVDKEKILEERRLRMANYRASLNELRVRSSTLAAQNDLETLMAALKIKVIDMYNGAIVVTKDALNNETKILGKIEDEYSLDSIFNEYGLNGSEYSLDSIWNQYGLYGGKHALLSPFNEYSTSPPAIIKDNKIIGYLTTNKLTHKAVDPNWLKQYFK